MPSVDIKSAPSRTGLRSVAASTWTTVITGVADDIAGLARDIAGLARDIEGRAEKGREDRIGREEDCKAGEH